MRNHAHLLLRTGGQAIASVMRRLLTGYAVSFNRRHGRQGHLFQNRYKSILCEEDRYHKQLVAGMWGSKKSSFPARASGRRRLAHVR